jgi:DNA polymerase-1
MADRPDKSESTVFLVDGTYTVFRSFFAIGRLSAVDGTPTNGVYGFLGTMRKLVREWSPSHIGVAFDLDQPTHRDELFEDYKANRAAPPDELVPQFALAMDASQAMGWPVLTAPGFEADDIIATLARRARAAGRKVVIVTSDKDLYQLVGRDVCVLNLAKEDRLLDADGVCEVFGVRPERVIDVLALMGDQIDNVPGVPGVGEKTAKTLVSRYGTLATILERARRFRRLWDLHEEALAACKEKDEARLAAALDNLRDPARWLAERESAVGDDEGRTLAERFGAAAELDAASGVRAVGKVLRQLGKGTQPKCWCTIADNEEQARRSLELVTLRDDVPIEVDIEQMRQGGPNLAEALDLFRRLGFRTLVEELQAAGAWSDAMPAAADGLSCELITSAEQLRGVVERMRDEGRPVAFDTETDSLQPRQARLVGIALANSESGGWYLPVGHRHDDQVAWEEARELLRPLLEDPSIPKVGQNLAYDLAVLRGCGLVPRGIGFDTLLAAQLLDPGRATSNRLDDLALRYLGARMISYHELAGGQREEVTLDLLPATDVARYAIEDAAVSWRLVDVLRGELEREGLLELFGRAELPLVPVLEEMEAAGVRIDVDRLGQMSAAMEEELNRLEREIHELAGHPFNVNSPQQLRTVLFDELGLSPTGRRTQKTRKHSTVSEVLEALADQHPLPGKVCEYRELAKLRGTYVDSLPKLVDARDGRVHTRFHQLGAATGRLSSSDPNLQNIPVRTAAGREIRACFLPGPGWKFVSADYSQMELRILAHLSGDPALVEAFRQGRDIHRYTAALVQGLDETDVTPELRARAKAVNFGIVYGMSEFRLAREQKMSREEARAFIAAYFARYPAVKEYIDGTIRAVQETGVVRTLLGRVRRFPDLLAGGGRLSHMQREALLRQAVNATVQGSGADIVKLAMVRIAERLRREECEARILLQVHDELLLEAPPGEVESVEALLREEMEQAVELAVPVQVDVRVGNSWSEVH